jgi:hypothetical protein
MPAFATLFVISTLNPNPEAKAYKPEGQSAPLCIPTVLYCQSLVLYSLLLRLPFIDQFQEKHQNVKTERPGESWEYGINK